MNAVEKKTKPKTTVLHVITSARTMLILTDHIREMEIAGIDYHVLANFNGTAYKADGKKLHQVELSRSLISLGDIKSFFSIRKKLKEISPDTIIVSTPKAALVGSVAAALFSRSSQLIYLVRGFRFPTVSGLKGRLIRFMEMFPARLADRTLGTSVQTVETIRNLLPKRYADSISVTLNGTANGIDMDVFSTDNPDLAPVEEVRARFGISKDAFVILIVGRVCVDKGFQELTTAFEKIKSKHPHAQLLVVGDDDASDALPTESQKRLDEISVRAGRIDNKKVSEVFRAADILAYPSHREGFGISAIEAAAMGTPTVASRIGGLQSAVSENVSGVFHPVGDSDAIAEKILHFIKDPDHLEEMSKSAVAHAKGRYDRRLYDTFWLDIFLSKAKPSNIAE